jgi:hypothetical protein
MINYCHDELCQNRGVCRPILNGYFCECLIGSYSGQHCEIIAMRIVILQAASKSMAYIAIIALLCVAMFVIIMDILKYCFGIDPVEEERRKIRHARRIKRQKDLARRTAKYWDGNTLIRATI